MISPIFWRFSTSHGRSATLAPARAPILQYILKRHPNAAKSRKEHGDLVPGFGTRLAVFVPLGIEGSECRCLSAQCPYLHVHQVTTNENTCQKLWQGINKKCVPLKGKTLCQQEGSQCQNHSGKKKTAHWCTKCCHQSGLQGPVSQRSGSPPQWKNLLVSNSGPRRMKVSPPQKIKKISPMFAVSDDEGHKLPCCRSQVCCQIAGRTISQGVQPSLC